MPSGDRPYFESQRDRERGYRDQEGNRDRDDSGRRDRWREDEDDRGPLISRDRDEFESGDFRGRERRFEELEPWERPYQMRGREFARHPSEGRSLRGRAFGSGYAGGGAYGSSGSTGRYAGLGPKGYQRSDDRLREDACERLTADPDVDAREIEVSAQNGEVTLEGTVSSRAMKRAAEDCVEAIPGVQQVHNRVRVQFNEAAREGREQGDASAEPFTKSTEGQRSGVGRKAH